MASNDDHLQAAGSELVNDNERSVSTTVAPSQTSNIQTVSPPVASLELVEASHSPNQHDTATRTSDAQPVAGGESTATTQQPSDANPLPATNPSPAELGASATEAPAAEQPSQESDAKDEDPGPSLVITLLLTSGSRHPFKIDGKYLRKRSVNVENYDPFAMSVYTLKELIWREWRQDWEPRPSSPSYIRLISFGKLLDDKAPLSDSKFNRDAPNVVHMTVKPQELIDEEDAKGAKTQYTREREASERSPGCRCIIQ
ncbi:hypothetical protein BBP40_009081 [Aspergillus hancockii]|nr:hypothetical protein BBP40_009081 [Aspergillus hancockii]